MSCYILLSFFFCQVIVVQFSAEDQKMDRDVFD